MSIRSEAIVRFTHEGESVEKLCVESLEYWALEDDLREMGYQRPRVTQAEWCDYEEDYEDE